MVTFNKFSVFAKDVAMGVHNLSTDAIKYRITNTLPVATMTILSCIATIATGNGWSTDVALTISNATLDGSTYRISFTDSTIEASGGAIAQFRYVVIYNDTPATPADPLIGWGDYGTAVDLSAGEKLVLDFDSTTGIITVV